MTSMIRFLLLILFSVALAGCGKQATYTYLIKNPGLLKQQLTKCQAQGKSAMNDATCRDAIVVAKVLNDYVALQDQYKQQLTQDRQTLMSMQASGEKTPIEQSTLNNFNSLMFNVQAGFAKKIMAAETRLSKLKQALIKTQQTLREGKFSGAKQKRIASNIVQLKNAISLQEQVINAMYAMLNLASPE
jgi:hypothetical protein